MPPVLGVQSPSHQTTREFPVRFYLESHPLSLALLPIKLILDSDPWVGLCFKRVNAQENVKKRGRKKLKGGCKSQRYGNGDAREVTKT